MKFDSAVGNVQLMQKINRLKVLDCIRKKGMVARPEIAKITGLSPSSITNIVTYLLEKNIVVEVGSVESRDVGRKATLLKFNPTVYNIIAVNIELSSVSLALTDLSGNIIKMKEIPLEHQIKDSDVLDKIKKEIYQLIGKSKKLSNSDVAGIGIAVSGLVLDDEKLVMSSSLRWKKLSIKQFFSESFEMPVYIQNNSRTKAISEINSDRGELDKNIIFLDLAMGVGVINFYDGKINEAIIGELGHTSVKKDGPLCFCGNRGCLEIMCSVDTVVSQCRELLNAGGCQVLRSMLAEDGSELNYDMVIDAYKNGDIDVKGVLEECGQYLGIGIANIINMFNPQRIVINGDVLLTCDYIFTTAIEEANTRAYEQFTDNMKYEKVHIDTKQAVRGVSIYVTDRLLDIGNSTFLE